MMGTVATLKSDMAGLVKKVDATMKGTEKAVDAKIAGSEKTLQERVAGIEKAADLKVRFLLRTWLRALPTLSLTCLPLPLFCSTRPSDVLAPLSLSPLSSPSRVALH